MIKLVVIDADDTLFMTEEATFVIENEIAVSMGHAPMTREMHQKNWGKPLNDAIQERIPGIDLTAFTQLVKQKIPEYVAEGKLDVLTPANVATLRVLKEKGKLMAVLTSREQYEAEHLLDPNHELQKYLHGLYHFGNTDYRKPDPRVFGPVLAHFGVEANEAVYVGDSPNDGRCAKGAGMHFIALLESGLRVESDFNDVAVDFFAPAFPDILSYVESH